MYICLSSPRKCGLHASVKIAGALGYSNILTFSSRELNLLDSDAIQAYFHENEVEQICLAGIKVGTIHANNT
jgi:GDP-L-fucose synthase